jgi:hypothetical protein
MPTTAHWYGRVFTSAPFRRRSLGNCQFSIINLELEIGQVWADGHFPARIRVLRDALDCYLVYALFEFLQGRRHVPEREGLAWEGERNRAGQGGGIYEEGPASLVVAQSTLANNEALGGAGGAGANGGDAFGGGIATQLATSGLPVAGSVTVSDSTLSGNQAIGGAGGTGGNGGNGLGGGIFVATGTTLCVLDSNLTGNKATGGATGSGGSAGQGIGGGIYITAGAIAGIQNSHVVGNKASNSNDDIFGVFSTSC